MLSDDFIQAEDGSAHKLIHVNSKFLSLINQQLTYITTRLSLPEKISAILGLCVDVIGERKQDFRQYYLVPVATFPTATSIYQRRNKQS